MKKIIITVWVISSFLIANAQDLVFAQYMGSSIYTNPSLTATGTDKFGNSSGRLSTLYRSQWATGTLNKYSSNYFAYDQKVSDGFGGLGCYLISDRAGADGLFASTQLNATYAYQTPFGKKGLVGRYGLSVGLKSQGVDISKLRFEDQINYTKGAVGNTQEVLPSNRVTKVDMNLGFMLHNEKFYFGMALHNITKPNYDYLGTVDNYLPRRMSIQSGGSFLILDGTYGSNLNLLPSLTIIKQQDFSQFNVGLGVQYQNFIISGGIRKSMINEKNSDAMLFSFGIIKDHLRLSYTYEKVVSGLRFYSPMTSEFGIQYTIENKRNKIDKVFKFPKM
jgi:type IX secretion system PorP/SprF family membrane protein